MWFVRVHIESYQNERKIIMCEYSIIIKKHVDDIIKNIKNI